MNTRFWRTRNQIYRGNIVTVGWRYNGNWRNNNRHSHVSSHADGLPGRGRPYPTFSASRRFAKLIDTAIAHSKLQK